MTPSVDFKYVAPDTQEFQQMQTFAKSFNHCILPSPTTSVHAMYRGDVCFGYLDVVYVPVSYPAFHPALTRPNDVIKAMAGWKSHIQLSGKGGYVGVPTEEDNGRPNFPESTMNKLGLYRMKRELYIPN